MTIGISGVDTRGRRSMASGTSSALECFETFCAKSFKNLFYNYEETENLIET